MGSTKYKAPSGSNQRKSKLSTRSQEVSDARLTIGNERPSETMSTVQDYHLNIPKHSQFNENLNHGSERMDITLDQVDEDRQVSSLSNSHGTLQRNLGFETTFDSQPAMMAKSSEYVTPTFMTFINGQPHYAFVVTKERATEEGEKARQLGYPEPLRVDEYPKKDLIPCQLPVKWVSTDTYPPTVIHNWWPKTFCGSNSNCSPIPERKASTTSRNDRYKWNPYIIS